MTLPTFPSPGSGTRGGGRDCGANAVHSHGYWRECPRPDAQLPLGPRGSHRRRSREPLDQATRKSVSVGADAEGRGEQRRDPRKHCLPARSLVGSHSVLPRCGVAAAVCAGVRETIPVEVVVETGAVAAPIECASASLARIDDTAWPPVPRHSGRSRRSTGPSDMAPGRRRRSRHPNRSRARC